MKVSVQQGEITIKSVSVLLEGESVLVLEVDSSAKRYAALMASGEDDIEVHLYATPETVNRLADCQGDSVITVSGIGAWHLSLVDVARYRARIVLIRPENIREIWRAE